MVIYGCFTLFLLPFIYFLWASLVAQRVKCLPAIRETWVQYLGGEDPLEKEWQPTPVFLPKESHRWRSLATVHRVAKSWTRLSDFSFL